MPDSFTSVQDFLDAYTGRDMGRKRAAIGLVKTAAGKEGVTRLSRISRDQIGHRAPVDFDAPGLTLVDALDDAVFEATDSSGDARYRKVLQTFFTQLDLLKEGAKNSVSDSSAHPVQETEGDMAALDALLSDPAVFGDGDDAENSGSRTGRDVTDAQRPGSQSPRDVHQQAPATPKLVSNSETNEPFDVLDDIYGSVMETPWEASRKADRMASGELMRLPGVLPPPPSDGTGEQYGAWLDGGPWHRLSIGLKIDLGAGDNTDDLIEIQSEFFANPSSAMMTYTARGGCDAEAGTDAAIQLHYAGRDLGRFTVTHDAAQELLSRAVMRYYEENEPKAADFLSRVGCRTRCTPQLAEAVSSALDIEAFFLEDAPRDAGQGPLSDIRGTISPRARLDVSYLLDRAVFMHFTSGVPLTTGLKECLVELRHAQVCRHLQTDVATSDFDAPFSRDWFTELEEYEGILAPSPSPM